jgi:cell division topological specificity factor
MVFEELKSRFFSKRLSNVTAKNRLQMVLVQDRSGLSSQEMELFKKDLMKVISKYFLIENKHLEVEWKRGESETALVINTPVTGRLKAAPRRAAAG